MMLIKTIIATVVSLYLLDRLYWLMVRGRARNQGLFRDDRRENDQR
jgi:hypothetical protein